GYEEMRDPKTGLPVTQTEANEESNGTPDGAFSLLQPQNSEDIAIPYAPSQVNPMPVNNGQRRLLQPTPQLFTEPGQMAEAMNNVEQGLGKAWATFPPYIYRVQTAYFEGESKQRWTKED